MTAVLPQVRVSLTLWFSLGLHAAVFLVLTWVLVPSEMRAPIGVEMRYMSPAVTVPSTPSSPVSQSRFAKDKKTEESSDQAAAPVGVRDGIDVIELERYKFELRLYLERRKIYPETARRLHQAGTVVVEFKINSQGDLKDINVTQSSGSEILNRAAVQLLRRASQFKPFPPGIQLSELKLILPIEYIL